jgi:hypothetical protein
LPSFVESPGGAGALETKVVVELGLKILDRTDLKEGLSAEKGKKPA